jgi:hypothetical protein
MNITLHIKHGDNMESFFILHLKRLDSLMVQSVCYKKPDKQYQPAVKIIINDNCKIYVNTNQSHLSTTAMNIATEKAKRIYNNLQQFVGQRDIKIDKSALLVDTNDYIVTG